MQLTVDAQTVFWETKGADLNYTSVAFPQSGMDTQLINYYDDYNFPDGNTYPYASASAKTKGLQTESKVKVLGTSTMLLGTVYYDDEGRPVKVFKQHYLGGIQKTSNYDEDLSGYNFSGELISSTRVHHAGSILTTIANRYTYDYAGRKINTYESINGSTQVVLNELKYNEIGQLIKKSLHSTDGTSFAQNSTYAYNERGWLNKINDPNALAADQIFGMELIYGNKAGTYNGNIGTVNWKTKVPAGLGLTEQLQSYTYDYDKLNRLSKSIYSAAGAANKFNEEMGYDISGNITSLKRANNSTGYLNNFTYNYGAGSTAGNQLLGVTDAGTAAQSSIYTYNENGNQKTDSRKGLTIAYNIMNLPQTISKTSTGETLKYVYDAAGQKLRKITGSSSKDYIAGIEYNNGVIESIQTEEGRALPGTSYSYEYTLKDNLGNTRAAFKQNGEIIQIQDYYAFGMEMNPGNRLTPSPDNLYGYNGKEKQAELGLEQLDYGARFYDPVIGRWSVPDMLAELAPNLTPYRYCFNNPVNYIDPFGLYEKNGTTFSATTPEDISRLMDFFLTEGIHNNTPSISQISGFIKAEMEKSGSGLLSDGSLLAKGFEIKTEKDFFGGEHYVTDEKSFSDFWHSVQGNLRPHMLDPRTLGHNLFWTIYPGGDNPKKYNGNDDYSYVPSSPMEMAAYKHDLAYDRLKIKGISGLLGDKRVIGADWRFVADSMKAAYNSDIRLIDRDKALFLGIGLGLLALPKTIEYYMPIMVSLPSN